METVERITVQFGGHEEVLIPNNSVEYERAITLVSNIRVSIKRYDFTPIFGGSMRTSLNIYLNNGKKIIITPGTKYHKYGFNFGYMRIDGVEYFMNRERYSRIEEFLQPYENKAFEKWS